jgi:hypothetical protein
LTTRDQERRMDAHDSQKVPSAIGYQFQLRMKRGSDKQALIVAKTGTSNCRRSYEMIPRSDRRKIPNQMSASSLTIISRPTVDAT